MRHCFQHAVGRRIAEWAHVGRDSQRDCPLDAVGILRSCARLQDGLTVGTFGCGDAAGWQCRSRSAGDAARLRRGPCRAGESQERSRLLVGSTSTVVRQPVTALAATVEEGRFSVGGGLATVRGLVGSRGKAVVFGDGRDERLIYLVRANTGST